jgi:predicted transcriptional regulator
MIQSIIFIFSGRPSPAARRSEPAERLPDERILINEKNISLKNFNAKIKEFQEKAYTVLIVAENKKIIGIIAVADIIKEDSKSAISKLNQQVIINGRQTTKEIPNKQVI